jgi:hypothetical protein
MANAAQVQGADPGVTTFNRSSESPVPLALRERQRDRFGLVPEQVCTYLQRRIVRHDRKTKVSSMTCEIAGRSTDAHAVAILPTLRLYVASASHANRAPEVWGISDAPLEGEPIKRSRDQTLDVAIVVRPENDRQLDRSAAQERLKLLAAASFAEGNERDFAKIGQRKRTPPPIDLEGSRHWRRRRRRDHR